MTQEKEALKLALEALEGLEALLLSMGLTHLIVYGDAEKSITAIKEALAQPDQYAKGNWINAEDVSRNVKALDIALNGEGAASSPLLIDVLGQVQAEARRIGKPVLKALAQPEPPPECPMDSYGDGNVYRGQRSRDSAVKTITLAQPEQEPVAWVSDREARMVWWNDKFTDIKQAPPNNTPLYTTPPQRKPLTDEQKMALCKQFPDHLTFNAIHAIEAAHGIKE